MCSPLGIRNNRSFYKCPVRIFSIIVDIPVLPGQSTPKTRGQDRRTIPPHFGSVDSRDARFRNRSINQEHCGQIYCSFLDGPELCWVHRILFLDFVSLPVLYS
jgi:hypothetical protein